MIEKDDWRLLVNNGESLRKACINPTDGEEICKYACYAGMWWTPENKLAYMEPLCTIPEYRRRGLASAALSELYRKMKPLGATHMAGGFHDFYKAIGYEPAVKWTYWKKI